MLLTYSDLKSLLAAGCDVNKVIDDNGNTHVHNIVTSSRDYRNIKLLVHNNADFNIKNDYGNTPFTNLVNSYYLDNLDLHIIRYVVLHTQLNVFTKRDILFFYSDGIKIMKENIMDKHIFGWKLEDYLNDFPFVLNFLKRVSGSIFNKFMLKFPGNIEDYPDIISLLRERRFIIQAELAELLITRGIFNFEYFITSFYHMKPCTREYIIKNTKVPFDKLLYINENISDIELQHIVKNKKRSRLCFTKNIKQLEYVYSVLHTENEYEKLLYEFYILIVSQLRHCVTEKVMWFISKLGKQCLNEINIDGISNFYGLIENKYIPNSVIDFIIPLRVNMHFCKYHYQCNEYDVDDVDDGILTRVRSIDKRFIREISNDLGVYIYSDLNKLVTDKISKLIL